MRYEVQITEGAERDLAEILSFLMANTSSDLTDRVLEGLIESANSLAEFPERGAHPQELLNLGIREFRQVMFQSYRLFYRIVGRQVFLLLVADGRRDFQSLLERRVLRG